MNENDNDIPLAVEAPRKRWSLPLVWVIPIVAALVGGWVAVKAVLDEGPSIVITFKTADGLEAGKTKLKFKDVQVGVVRQIRLGDDHQSVEVTAELDKNARQLLAKDTRYWVVRAQISGSKVSGLSTLLSGSYIGVDPGNSPEQTKRFTGLETQPIVTADLPGKHFILRAEELGSIDIGAPLFYRRIEVGSVVAYELDAKGEGVDMKVFVHAPYDKYVNAQTRFWNASGVDMSISSEGLRLRTEGLTSILVGGIAFQTPLHVPGGQPPAAANSVFSLHGARDVALQRPVTEVLPVLLTFDDSVRGLEPGAPMTFKGVPVGEVTAVGLQLDSEKKVFHTVVDVSFYPERLWERVRGTRPATPSQKVALWQTLVDRGLRAQLRSGNLLTGQMYVALETFPDRPKVTLNWTKLPLEFPTMPGDREELQKTIRDIAKRLDEVPIANIGKELDKTLRETAQLMAKLNKDVAPQATATLQSVQESLKKAEVSMLSEDAPLQQDARETMRELSRAAQSLRALADYLERHPESLIRGKSGDAP